MMTFAPREFMEMRPAAIEASAISGDYRFKHAGDHDGQEGQRKVDGFVIEGPNSGRA